VTIRQHPINSKKEGFVLKKFILLAGMAAAIAGCSTSANRLAEVSPGMNKSQVISILGSPESVSGQGSGEVFTYTLSNSWNSPVWNEKYYVYFVNGQVVRYGK
jgi:outer membrane protein assembly factor BamE (lipoprotein component of BamABCDE complex)